METLNINSVKENTPIFSIVTAVYNCEDYIQETLESVINQELAGFQSEGTGHQLSFEQVVQLILVDDGSTDRSGEICDRYAEKYSNIKVIHKENGGAASARNEGKRHATGRYVNFLDSDDLFSENVLIEVYRFFEKHYDEMDVLAIPMFHFDGKEGPVWMNYKFDGGSRVINLLKDHTASVMFVTSAFFKNSDIKKYEFDPALTVGEDQKFLFPILLQKSALGVIDNCKFMYRKRSAGGSITQTSQKTKEWYFDYFVHLYDWVEEYCVNLLGETPLFVQHTVMMDLSIRLRAPFVPDVLSEPERKRYHVLLLRTIKRIDDSIIMEQRYLNFVFKIYALKLKHDEDIISSAVQRRTAFYYRDRQVFNAAWQSVLLIDILEVNSDHLCIEGTTSAGILNDDWQLYAKLGAEHFEVADLYPRPDRDIVNHNGEAIFNGIGFRFFIPIQAGDQVRFFLKWKDNPAIQLKPWYGSRAKFTRKVPHSYHAAGELLLKSAGKGIKIYKNRWKTRTRSELRYLKALIKDGNFRSVFYRIGASSGKCFRTCTVVYGTGMTEDEQQALLRHLVREDQSQKVKWYLVDMQDDKESNHTHVLKPNSARTRLKLLMAEKSIVRYPVSASTNYFGTDLEFVKDLYKFDYVMFVDGQVKPVFS